MEYCRQYQLCLPPMVLAVFRRKLIILLTSSKKPDRPSGKHCRWVLPVMGILRTSPFQPLREIPICLMRIRHCFPVYDILRIDNFRGFDEYYSIPYGEQTAINGTHDNDTLKGWY